MICPNCKNNSEYEVRKTVRYPNQNIRYVTCLGCGKHYALRESPVYRRITSEPIKTDRIQLAG